MSNYRSFWLKEDVLLLPYQVNEPKGKTYRCWAIGVRDKSKVDGEYNLHGFEGCRKRYFTEEECLKALQKYAKKKGLKPAW